MTQTISSESSNLVGIFTSLPGRYARALFDLAQESQDISMIEESLSRFYKVIQESKELQTVFHSPIVDKIAHQNIVIALSEKLNMPDILQHFLVTLAQNKRLSLLPDILNVFKDVIARHHTTRYIDIASAHELTAGLKDRLTKILSTAYTEKLILTFSITPSLLGGVMVKDGNRVIDATLRAHFSQLATAMKGVG